jgi:hypothetical protein
MNDFTRIVIGFGRGIIKLLISVAVGVGVALLAIGIVSNNRIDDWGRIRDPEIFIGVGAGLLSGGGTLLALFFLPLFTRRPAETLPLEEPVVRARPAPKTVRPVAIDDDSVPPIVKPVAPPPRPEPGSADFYEK